MLEVTGVHDEGLGNTSWLVDLGDGSALVMDPRCDPRPYLSAARRRGLRVRLVAETHLHADFVSGATGAVAGGVAAWKNAGLDLASTRPLDRPEHGSTVLDVHCMHGQRSMTAVSILERTGRDDVAVYTGGPDQWIADCAAA